MISIHENIKSRLAAFLAQDSIPNMIFHGPTGSGKRTLVYDYVSQIYGNDKDLIDAYVLNEDCAHGKGIKFVRDDLKLFARTHVNAQGSGHVKTIVLTNAGDLTTDAQSALRRCIELFSKSTRFFLVVEDKSRLLRPILSRFCEIHVPLPLVNGHALSLHRHRLIETLGVDQGRKSRLAWIKKQIGACQPSYVSIMDLVNSILDKGYSGIDVLDALPLLPMPDARRTQLQLVLNKTRHDLRNEALFLLFSLNLIIIRSDCDLENMGHI